MVTGYVENIFINPAIEYGIANYLNYQENGNCKNAYIFEMYVIKALCIIYGEKSVILPYKIDNEKAFKCNLLMYDLKESDMELFIKYMNDYYEYMRHIKDVNKPTDLIMKIETILIEMINRRGKKHAFTPEEFAEFDTIFNPLNGNLKKIKSLVASNSGLIVNIWNNKKEELSNTQLHLMAINPNLLHPSMYSKYGYEIKEIALMSQDAIEEVNRCIVEEETKNNLLSQEKTIKTNKFRIVLTSGNGFVDKLMLLSIIATEIMVGLIIAVQLGG